jgi:hypothetical protein
MGRARSVPSKNIPLAVLALSVSSLAALALGGPAARRRHPSSSTGTPATSTSR